MFARGKLHSPHLATQPRDFSGLRYGTITPTDFDAFIDFGGRLFVLIEAKLTGITLPHGQRLAIERVVDGWEKAGIRALAVVCEHRNRIGEIDVANCEVVQYRSRGLWREPTWAMSVRQLVDHARLHYGVN